MHNESLERVQNSLGKHGSTQMQYYALYNALPPAWRVAAHADGFNLLDPVFCGMSLDSLTTHNIRSKLVAKKKKNLVVSAFGPGSIPN